MQFAQPLAIGRRRTVLQNQQMQLLLQWRTNTSSIQLGKGVVMSNNMVTIGAQPATESFAIEPQSATQYVPPKAELAPAQVVQVTDKAIKRIRVAMAKEGISPEQGGLRLGVIATRIRLIAL